MAGRTIKGGMLARPLITHYSRGRTEHYTLVDLLSTVKYIIKVPKTQSALCWSLLSAGWGRLGEISCCWDVTARKRLGSRLLIWLQQSGTVLLVCPLVINGGSV